MQQHGLLALYVGALPTALRQATGLGVRFCTYDETKKLLLAHSGKTCAWHSVVAGGVCGALSVVANNPLDVVKSRLQSVEVSKERQTTWRVTLEIAQSEGLRALYAGVAPRFLKICAGQAIVFGVYENIGVLFRR